jgi:DNA-directed RNA polymerase subunit RPC12/RpoP
MRCIRCNNKFENKDDIIEIPEGKICSSCFWNENFVCSLCGNIFSMDDMGKKDLVCRDCEKSSEII